MLVKLLNSKRDRNGNRYWAVSVSDLGNILHCYVLPTNCVSESACHALGYEFVRIELSKREFSRLTKDWPHDYEQIDKIIF